MITNRFNKAILGIAGLLFFSFCDLKEPLLKPTDDPRASFTADKTTGTVPLTVQFTDASTGTGITKYEWNFGDNSNANNTSTQKNPPFTYTRAGTYEVNLTVTGKFGSSKATSKTITVTLPNGKPLAQFACSISNNSRAPAILTVVNNALSAVRYSWLFGDGTAADTNRTPAPHNYATAGKYTVTLSAYNAIGDRHDTTCLLVIKPTACFNVVCDPCLAPSALASFDGTCSTNSDSYSWNFGDPSSTTNTANAPKPTHTFTTEGVYSITLVTTKNSASDTITRSVTVKSFTKDTSFANLGPAKRVIRVADGYVIAGATTSASGTNVYLMKVGFNLNVVYSNPLTTSGTNSAEGLVQLSDGSFAIAGTGFNTANNTDDILYMRTNSSGVLIVPPTMFGVGTAVASDKAKNIIETPDGNILIVGSTFNSVSSTSDVCIIKRKPDLTTTYFNQAIVGANDETAYSVVGLDNNAGFLLTGTTSAPGSAKPTDVFFMKVDATFNNPSVKTTGLATSNESALAIVKTSTGNYMTCGLTTETGIQNSYLVLADATGTTLNNIRIPSSIAQVAKDLKLTPDGGFIIAGEQNLDAFTLKVNAQGVPEGIVNLFGSGGRDSFESVALANDGGYVFVGSKNGVLYIVKTNKNGSL